MKDQLADEELLSKVDRLKPIADSYGLTMGQLAIAALLAAPGMTSVIVGATSPGQLAENAKASGVKLREADRDAIDALFSPPKDGGRF
jgi:aryl-alcohol dehydrogenase-like predicted oxidoreductase